jgi:hypothetical protein
MTELRQRYLAFKNGQADQLFRGPIIASGATVAFTILLLACMLYLATTQSDQLAAGVCIV